jgi:hypothetical protein|tara:strand:+ start:995 stop:1135 length:141 start_codon:yes stop_codon:yes gene_type:complete
MPKGPGTYGSKVGRPPKKMMGGGMTAAAKKKMMMKASKGKMTARKK